MSGWGNRSRDQGFKLVVATWQDADAPLLTFVQQAQAGLARLRGAVEGRS